jgi:hypothetical protein
MMELDELSQKNQNERQRFETDQPGRSGPSQVGLALLWFGPRYQNNHDAAALGWCRFCLTGFLFFCRLQTVNQDKHMEQSDSSSTRLD